MSVALERRGSTLIDRHGQDVPPIHAVKQADELFDDGDGAVKANIPSPILYSFNVTRARIMLARRPEVTRCTHQHANVRSWLRVLNNSVELGIGL